MDECEWISVNEAAGRLAPRFGGMSRAKEAISIGLHEGLIEATAEVMMFLNEKSEFEEAEAGADSLIEIPTDTWAKSANWQRDLLSWDWADGAFEVECYDPWDSVSYVGVHVSATSIEKIEPGTAPFNPMDMAASPATSLLDSLKTKRSVPRKYDWDPVLVELIAMANHPDGLEQFGSVSRGFQSKLEVWLGDEFERQGQDRPSEDQCRRRARMVRQALERQRAH